MLIVDDSAFARKVVRESLLSSPRIEVVGIARDGIDALEKIVALQPDVITLDLVMPNLDGLGVLAALTAEQRSRVVVVSMSDGESDVGIRGARLRHFRSGAQADRAGRGKLARHRRRTRGQGAARCRAAAPAGP